MSARDMLDFFFLILTSFHVIFVDLRVSGADRYECRPWSVYGMDKPINFIGCYIKSNFNLTWAEARDFCSNNGGYLFMPSEIYEITIYQGEYDCVFIGLIWDSVVGWKWLNGESPAEEKWDERPVRPVNNSSLPCATICQALHHKHTGMHKFWWSTRSCEEKMEFICEYDPTSVGPERPEMKPLPSSQKPRTIGFRTETLTRVIANPDMETKTFSTTLCARECHKHLNPCALLSHNTLTETCLGFTSMDVMAGRKSGQKGWTTLVALIE